MIESLIDSTSRIYHSGKCCRGIENIHAVGGVRISWWHINRIRGSPINIHNAMNHCNGSQVWYCIKNTYNNFHFIFNGLHTNYTNSNYPSISYILNNNFNFKANGHLYRVSIFYLQYPLFCTFVYTVHVFTLMRLFYTL